MKEGRSVSFPFFLSSLPIYDIIGVGLGLVVGGGGINPVNLYFSSFQSEFWHSADIQRTSVRKLGVRPLAFTAPSQGLF